MTPQRLASKIVKHMLYLLTYQIGVATLSLEIGMNGLAVLWMASSHVFQGRLIQHDPTISNLRHGLIEPSLKVTCVNYLKRLHLMFQIFM